MTVEFVDLWRCAECGRWSHAKRKPLRHERFFGLEPPEDDSRISRTEEAQETDTGAWVTAYWVNCGPFDDWNAMRVVTP